MKTNTDKNTNTGLLSRPEPRSKNVRPQIDLASRQTNRALCAQNLLALLEMNAPDFFAVAELVGQWVWIQFEDKQPGSVTRLLAEFGFHWNNARQAWQHPCGVASAGRANGDPRKRYGSSFPAAKAPAESKNQDPQLSVKLSVKILKTWEKIVNRFVQIVLELPLKKATLPLI